MSDYRVPYTTIREIKPHFNAERLEVATVYGFQVVTQKGRYKPGDSVIYIPIDSVLPLNLENFLFPPDSKIRLSNHRVRQIRIRGLASQGMIVDPDSGFFSRTSWKPEEDLAHELGVTKYEPPAKGPAQTIGRSKHLGKVKDHPLFHKYNGLDNIKWFPDLFEEGEPIVIQEKLHGTNARASILPFIANTRWKKFLKFLRLGPKLERHYGSNNVQISGKFSKTGYYGEDVYGECFHRMGIFDRIPPGHVLYGEIVGPGIQKGYDYGLTETKFYLFDVKQIQPDGSLRYLDPNEVELFATVNGFAMVPTLYKGSYNKETAYKLTFGPSVLAPSQKVREGVVLKSATGYDLTGGGKRALKWVSEEYLSDETNTDNH